MIVTQLDQLNERLYKNNAQNHCYGAASIFLQVGETVTNGGKATAPRLLPLFISLV